MFKQWGKIVCVIAMIPRQPPGLYVLAAVIAVVPLFILAAAAPGGGDWRWLEYPRYMTFFAAAFGIAACFAKSRQIAFLVLAGTVVIALAWEMIGEYVGLSKFGRTDLFSTELKLLVDLSVARAAPWLVGSAYAAIALLSITRVRDARTNRRRAGTWLIAVALVALAITYKNESWLTLENLSEHGTYRSSVAWPDTKKLSLVADLFAIAMGLAFWLYRPSDNGLPKATVHKD